MDGLDDALRQVCATPRSRKEAEPAKRALEQKRSSERRSFLRSPGVYVCQKCEILQFKPPYSSGGPLLSYWECRSPLVPVMHGQKSWTEIAMQTVSSCPDCESQRAPSFGGFFSSFCCVLSAFCQTTLLNAVCADAIS